MLNDIRYAFRQFVRRPGFTTVMVLTLGLGIGATTTVFSAVYAVLLAPAPYEHPEALRILRPTLTNTAGQVDTLGYWSYPAFEAFRAGTPELTDVAAYTPRALSFNLAGSGTARRVAVEIVSSTYLDVLGVEAQLGRGFVAEEDRTPGTHPVSLISHGLWQDAFGGDSGIVGRQLLLDGTPLTIVGVLPPSFSGLSERADMWVPMMMAPTLTFQNRLRGTLSFWHAVVARVADAQHAARLETLLARVSQPVAQAVSLEDAFGPVQLGFAAVPLMETRTNPELKTALMVLFGVVALVLLIACANVANLLLARGARRGREIGVRVAIGISRRRLARQLVTESVVLGLLGASLGLALAAWGTDLIAVLGPPALAGTVDLANVGLQVPVLGFNFGVALLAAAVFGAFPVMSALRSDPRVLLSGEGEQRGSRGPLGALVAVETALALVLLVGTMLFVRSFSALQATPIGFEPQHVLSAYVNIPRQAYDSAGTAQFYEELVGRLAALPGVRTASAANCLPLAGGCDRPRMQIRDDPAGPDAVYDVWMNMVGPDYFAALGIPVIRGRSIDERDGALAPRVAVVSQEAARQHWPDGDPVGDRIRLSVGWGPEDDYAEIVGVVGDVADRRPEASRRPGVYLSFDQYFYMSNYVIAEAVQDPYAVAGSLERILADLDPELSLWDLQSMEDRAALATAPERFTTVLVSLFGALSLVLGAVGLYGVMSFAVAARTREIGVRIAVGASQHDVTASVVRDGLRFALAGVALGLIVAVLSVGVLRSQLYGVPTHDPMAFGVALIVLLGAAAVAAYVPARRAARVDPMEALRYE